MIAIVSLTSTSKKYHYSGLGKTFDPSESNLLSSPCFPIKYTYYITSLEPIGARLGAEGLVGYRLGGTRSDHEKYDKVIQDYISS